MSPLESLLSQIAAQDGICVVDEGRTVATYALVWRIAEANAGALLKLGFHPAGGRQPLLVSASLGWRFLPVLLGALQTAVTVIPVNPSRYRGHHDGIRAYFPFALCLDESNVGEDGLLLRNRIPEPARPRDPALEDVAFVLATSGTTGSHKAVMLTEANVACNVRAISSYFSLEKRDRLLVARSPIHASALTGELLTGLAAGCSFSLHPPDASPANLLKRAETDSATVACMPPSMAHLLAPFAERAELGMLHRLVLSGECAHEAQLERIAAAFAHADLWNAYGLTEASPRVSCLTGGWLQAGWSCAGEPLPGVDIRIVDEEGKTVCEGERGELLVRGPNVMKGYYSDEPATRSKLADSWLRTSDLAAVRNGRLHVFGRSDSTIIRGGNNIQPGEVESALLACPGVTEAMAFGVRDNRLGNRIHAWIVTEPGVDEKSVMRALAASAIERRLLPDVLERKASLGRTPGGKLLRHAAKRS